MKTLQVLTLRTQTVPSLNRLHLLHMVRREEVGAGEELLEELVAQRRPEEDKLGLWTNLRLDWVRNWDPSCRTSILLSRCPPAGRLPQMIHRALVVPDPLTAPISSPVFCVSEVTSCNPAVLWRYLTALHDQRRVVDWIQNQENPGGSRWPELTPELVNNNTACSSYMREQVLDLLAR